MSEGKKIKLIHIRNVKCLLIRFFLLCFRSNEQTIQFQLEANSQTHLISICICFYWYLYVCDIKPFFALFPFVSQKPKADEKESCTFQVLIVWQFELTMSVYWTQWESEKWFIPCDTDAFHFSVHILEGESGIAIGSKKPISLELFCVLEIDELWSNFC